MVDCPVPSDGAAEWLEPDAGRLARPVLRGRWRSTAPPLPDIGVDADSGLVHSVVGTAANVSDVSQAHVLLHGHEEEAFGDAGYLGVDNRDEMKGKPVKWRVAAKRGKIKAMQEGPLKDLVIAVERTKAQIRARVEHPFHVVKNLFHHRKVRYKGLAKNTAQLFSLFALANLVIAKNQLRSTHGSNPSCV
jgi:transposase, IS5 family